MNNPQYVYISIGSNINRAENIAFVITWLQENVDMLVLSSIYETKAEGFEGNNFYNLVAGFESTLTIDEIIDNFKALEIQQGRVHSAKKFSDRTLDIDVLLYGHQNLIKAGYNIPRDEILKFAFVLKPLCDIAPSLIHPQTQQSILWHWTQFVDKPEMISITLD